ncbi:MAG: potassium channel family protein [Pseudomonadota bacterium]
MILQQLVIGMAAIAASVVIHASFMVVLLGHMERFPPHHRSSFARAVTMVGIVLWFFLSICLICWGWAMLLRWLGALGSMEEALYFATVTFTTLGYGDVVLEQRWRLLGVVAATNGTMIIGWTTAMIFVGVQRVYDEEDP